MSEVRTALEGRPGGDRQFVSILSVVSSPVFWNWIDDYACRQEIIIEYLAFFTLELKKTFSCRHAVPEQEVGYSRLSNVVPVFGK